MHPFSDLLAPFVKELKPVDYCYMITGEWGSGKTYYIKNIFEKDFADFRGKILYASANGVTCFPTIKKQLFQSKLFKEESPNALKVAQRIRDLSGLIPMETLLNLKFPGAGSVFSRIFKAVEETGMQLAEMTLSPLKDDLIIIDDLERLSKTYSIIDLLGDINTEYIEHNNIKVLLVCDDSKLQEVSTSYGEKKEKLIRRTLLFEQPISSIIDILIGGAVLDDKIEALLSGTDNIDFILSCFGQNNVKNLRKVKFIIESFEAIAREIEPEQAKLIFKPLFLSTVILSLEFLDSHFTASTSESEMEYLQHDTMPMSVIMDKGISEAEQQDIDKDANFRKRYISIINGTPYILFESVRNYVKSGRVDALKLKKEVEIFLSNNKPETEESQWLHHMVLDTKLPDLEFRDCLTKILEAIHDGKYSFYQLEHFYQQARMLIDEGIITRMNEEKLDEILTEAIPLSLSNTTYSSTHFRVFGISNRGYNDKMKTIIVEAISQLEKEGYYKFYSNDFNTLIHKGEFPEYYDGFHDMIFSLQDNVVKPLASKYVDDVPFRYHLYHKIQGIRCRNNSKEVVMAVLRNVILKIEDIMPPFVEGRSHYDLKGFKALIQELEKRPAEQF